MPFAIALIVSALLHAAAIGMPGWDLSGMGEPDSPPLDVVLVPPPDPVAAPAPVAVKPKPRRPVANKVVHAEGFAVEAAEATAPAAVPEAMPATAEPPPAVIAEPEPPSAPPPAASPVEPPWPRQGRLRYVARYGEGGFVIGETVQEWHIDGGRYAITSVFEPKGLAALRGRTRRQASEGGVTAAGLQPYAFRDQREGREAESASFDWSGGKVVFSGGRGESIIADGAQDMLSVFYQLAWQAPRQTVEMTVANASRVGRWSFEWVGEEKLELAAGSLATLHLRTRAEGLTTEVWLAPGLGGLPVKIRHVDRKGDAFEQVADPLELK